MKKKQLAERLAKESHISTAAAADQLDRMVSDILARVRKGESASLPGLGIFLPASGVGLRFEPGKREKPRRRGPAEEPR